MKHRPAVRRPFARRTGRRTATLALVVCLLAVAASATPSPAAAASAGELYAFGWNHFGQLGNTANNNTESPNPTPTQVTLPGASGAVIQVAAGQDHSLALTSTGQLYAFGLNTYGQLGSTANNGTFNPNPTPTQVSPPGASGPVTQIATGALHSLALTSTGQLYAFGANSYGQLGSTANNGTEAPNPTPTQVSLPGASGPVTQIAAGGRHSLVLTSTGQLYTFGENNHGQLGSTANSGTLNPNPTPTQVSLPGASGPVTQIAAGGYHSLALTSTGQLYAFGENDYGQLGSTANNGTEVPNPTPTQVSLPGASGAVTQIAAGQYHSLALTSTGQLYAFGENYYGQLGSTPNNGTEVPNPTPTPVSLPGASGPVTQFAAGGYHSLALTSTGQLYAFGANSYGQLGSTANNGTINPNPTPTPVDLGAGTTIDTMATGSTAFHSLVVVADLAVTTGSLPAGQVGAPYSATATASGGAPPYSWQASGLPAGLSIDPASGQISGTPSAAGSAQVTLTVTDRFGILAASATQYTVAKATSSVLLGASPSSGAAPGQAVRLLASVSGASPGGSVVFKVGKKPIGEATLGANGQAKLATRSLAPGRHKIRALYSGDANNQGSTSPPLRLRIAPLPKPRLHHTPNTPHQPNPKGGPRYTFVFSDPAAGARFQCRLDRQRKWRRCSSPKVYRHVKRGRHVFRLRSIDRAGNRSPVRAVRFFVGRRR